MDLLQVAVTAVGAFAALFLLSKLMGHRQISELSSLTTSMASPSAPSPQKWATELEKPAASPRGMVVWALLVWLLEAD